MTDCAFCEHNIEQDHESKGGRKPCCHSLCCCVDAVYPKAGDPPKAAPPRAVKPAGAKANPGKVKPKPGEVVINKDDPFSLMP